MMQEICKGNFPSFVLHLTASTERDEKTDLHWGNYAGGRRGLAHSVFPI